MATYTITGSDHDHGGGQVTLTRVGLERAQWSARLMRECGFRTIVIDEVNCQ